MPAYLADFKKMVSAEDWPCDICGYRTPEGVASTLQVHHIEPRCIGGKDVYENLAVLCPNCHALAHGVGRYAFEDGRRVGWIGPRNVCDLIVALRSLTPKPNRKLTKLSATDSAQTDTLNVSNSRGGT